jgi:hypothetical protein
VLGKKVTEQKNTRVKVVKKYIGFRIVSTFSFTLKVAGRDSLGKIGRHRKTRACPGFSVLIDGNKVKNVFEPRVIYICN